MTFRGDEFPTAVYLPAAVTESTNQEFVSVDERRNLIRNQPISVRGKCTLFGCLNYI